MKIESYDGGNGIKCCKRKCNRKSKHAILINEFKDTKEYREFCKTYVFISTFRQWTNVSTIELLLKDVFHTSNSVMGVVFLCDSCYDEFIRKLDVLDLI